MPSAEETSYLIEVMPGDSGQDNFTSHDVDVLVSRIKENLRLSSLKSAKRVPRRQMRFSPYNDWTASYNRTVREGQEQNHKSIVRRSCKKNWKMDSSRARRVDSYERFKTLLRNGLLIKEAVKRLQTYDEEDEDKDNSWEEESCSTRRASTTSATSTTLEGLDSMDD